MKSAFLFALLSLLPHFLFAASRYYVAETGNDSNDGLSWQTAFAGVQKAIDGAAVRVAYLLTPKAVIKPHRDKFLTDREIISGAEETIKIYANNCYGLSIH